MLTCPVKGKDMLNIIMCRNIANVTAVLTAGFMKGKHMLSTHASVETLV